MPDLLPVYHIAALKKSLYFEGDRTYFISNGYDAESGRDCIQMCEIDIETGKKKSALLSKSGTAGKKWLLLHTM